MTLTVVQPKPYDAIPILSLYNRAAGTSEIPAAYHTWIALALISAAVGDRVHLRKFAFDRLVPNLFVFLIGPSALGKGGALAMAAQFLPALPRTRFHRGPITGQRLFNKLGIASRDPTGPAPGKLLLIHEELAMDIGDAEIAKQYIKHLTGLYKAGDPYPITKGTQTDGDVMITNHCITMIAGTTKAWLVESVPRSAIEGGFLGRTACIVADYNFNKRIAMPVSPPDYEGIVAHLKERFAVLNHLEAEVTMGAEFEALYREWYEIRPAPEDMAVAPTWKREPDMVLKLATLMLLGEPFAGGRPRTVLEKQHWDLAIRLAKDALGAVPDLVAFASQTADGAKLEVTRAAIKGARRIQHSVLQRRLSGRGIVAKVLADHIRTLVDEKRIVVGKNENGGTVYEWKARPRVVIEEVPPTGDGPEEDEEGTDDESE